jgi:hypothetical protein
MDVTLPLLHVASMQGNYPTYQDWKTSADDERVTASRDNVFTNNSDIHIWPHSILIYDIVLTILMLLSPPDRTRGQSGGEGNQHGMSDRRVTESKTKESGDVMLGSTSSFICNLISYVIVRQDCRYP